MDGSDETQLIACFSQAFKPKASGDPPIVFIGLAVPLAPVEDTAPGQFRLLTSSSAFLQGLADSVDLSPVFLDGAYADSRDGEEFCGVCGTPLSNGSQRLIVEDAERRQTPPPRFEQSPGTQRLFDA